VSRLRFPHSVIVKSPGLLPMLYKVGELAKSLSIPDRTIRDWLVAGAPHSRDHRDNLWINGKEFADWVTSLRKKRKHKKLEQGEAYCVRCNQVVAMTEVTTHARHGKLVMISGKCPNCGRRIWRGDRIPTSPANNMTCQDIHNEN
jgi:predicted RNA-binding Zn-ribbon protein involved in translation (DUF1610 family)